MCKIKNIKSTNSKGQAHGYWEVYYSAGTLMYSGYYKNDKHVGLWGFYYSNGELSHKDYYNYRGNIEGIRIYE